MLKVVSSPSTRPHLPCKVQKPPSNKKRNQRPQRPCHISVKLARSYRTTSDSFNRISTRFRTSSLSRSSKRLLRRSCCRNRANSGLIGKLKEYCHLSRPARELSLRLDQPSIMHTHIRVLIQSKRAMQFLEAFRVAQQRELQPKRVAFLKKTKYVLTSHTANSSQQLNYLHPVT